MEIRISKSQFTVKGEFNATGLMLIEFPPKPQDFLTKTSEFFGAFLSPSLDSLLQEAKKKKSMHAAVMLHKTFPMVLKPSAFYSMLKISPDSLQSNV